MFYTCTFIISAWTAWHSKKRFRHIYSHVGPIRGVDNFLDVGGWHLHMQVSTPTCVHDRFIYFNEFKTPAELGLFSFCLSHTEFCQRGALAPSAPTYLHPWIAYSLALISMIANRTLHSPRQLWELVCGTSHIYAIYKCLCYKTFLQIWDSVPSHYCIKPASGCFTSLLWLHVQCYNTVYFLIERFSPPQL